MLPYAKSVVAEFEKMQLERDELNGLQSGLKRIPYKIVAKELDVPAYRNIGLALRSKKTASLAIKRFWTIYNTDEVYIS